MPGQHENFLINPYGLLYEEVTASSLVKIDVEGNKVEPSDQEVNSGGFAIPSTVHRARPEVDCVLHTRSIAGCEWPALLRKLDRIDPSYKELPGDHPAGRPAGLCRSFYSEEDHFL